ncbi:hypothetical protein MJO28_000492 [Puccinia striiformis f. sp. tritici]|uniref:Uncharacterized protein n=1 Tax=Puccinia striiformis f. sp. tritici TaxID=168172 RepID=A0ACC0EXK4_9BASI|nr:hypothetical protein MJO28_000492 [Puccinia striiformis f. sp. tritici]
MGGASDSINKNSSNLPESLSLSSETPFAPSQTISKGYAMVHWALLLIVKYPLPGKINNLWLLSVIKLSFSRKQLVGNALGTQDLPGLGRHLDPVSALELTGESRHSSDSEHIARSSAIKTLARGDDLVPAGEEQRLLDFGPCYNGHHEVVIQIESGGKKSSGRSSNPIRSSSDLDTYHIQGNPNTLERLDHSQVNSIQRKETCVICQETLEAGQISRILRCRHLFHTHCIDKWFEQLHASCPLFCNTSNAYTPSVSERARMLMLSFRRPTGGNTAMLVHNTDGTSRGVITFDTRDICRLFLVGMLSVASIAFAFVISILVLANYIYCSTTGFIRLTWGNWANKDKEVADFVLCFPQRSLVENVLATQDLPGLGRHPSPVSALELTAGSSRAEHSSEHISRNSAIQTYARNHDHSPGGEEQRLLDFVPCSSQHARHEVATEFETEGKELFCGTSNSIRSGSNLHTYHVKGNPRTLERLSPSQVDSIQRKDTCVICLESLGTGQISRILRCQHLFHTHCIDKWLENLRACCPFFCNRSRDYNPSAYEKARMLMISLRRPTGGTTSLRVFNTDGTCSGFITFVTRDVCVEFLVSALWLSGLAFVVVGLILILTGYI